MPHPERFAPGSEFTHRTYFARSGKLLGWKAYGVGVVLFNVLLALFVYLVMSLVQWGFFR